MRGLRGVAVVSGPEHYREAERLMREVACTTDSGEKYYGVSGGELVAILPQLLAGLTHATLALAAAVVRPEPFGTSSAWTEALEGEANPGGRSHG